MWPKDRVIHFHHGRERALPEAGHGAQRVAPVRRGGAELVGPVLAFLRKAQFQAQPLQQVAREAARVTRRFRGKCRWCARPAAPD